jgi:bacterioferritin
MKDEEVIETLNYLLQGTYIGIDAYNRYLNHVEDYDLRHRLEKQELLQERIAHELSSHIRDLGGVPKDNPGLKGTMANLMVNLNLTGGRSPFEILNFIADGLRNAIDKLEEAAMGLDGNSKALVLKHLTQDQAMFREIEEYKRRLLH